MSRYMHQSFSIGVECLPDGRWQANFGSDARTGETFTEAVRHLLSHLAANGLAPRPREIPRMSLREMGHDD